MVLSNAAGRRDVRVVGGGSPRLDRIPVLRDRNVRVATIPGTLNERDSELYRDTTTNLQYELLEYIHSDDARINMESDRRWDTPLGSNPDDAFYGSRNVAFSNQHNESWAESIVISNPTGGEDSDWTTAILVAIGVGTVTIVGAGIVIIKKFVLKS